MKRVYAFIILFVISFSVLSGCGKKDDVNNESTADTEALTGDEEVTETEAYEPIVFDLFSVTDVDARMFITKDGRLGHILYMCEYTNNTERSIIISCENLVINGDIYCQNTLFDSLEIGEKSYRTSGDLSKELSMAGIERLESISFDLRISDGDTYESIYEDKVLVEVPEYPEPQVTWLPYKGARAGEQILLDNDNVKVVLKGLGNYISESHMHDLYSILYIENKSDKDIPIGATYVSLSGSTYELTGPKGDLAAGHSTYLDYYINESALSDLDIITDVDMLILTDKDEITGTFTYNGGSWYTIELDEAGIADEEEITGELLFSGADVDIYVDSRDIDENFTDDGTYTITYYLTAVNNSDENVEIKVLDGEANGVPIEHSFGHNISVYKNEIGAHKKAKCKLILRGHEKEEYPDIKVTFQLRSFGGGYIIYTDDKPTFINKDGSINKGEE